MAKKTVREDATKEAVIGIPYAHDPSGRQTLDPVAAIKAILHGQPSLEVLATQERYPIDSVITMRSDLLLNKYSILDWYKCGLAEAKVTEVKAMGKTHNVNDILIGMKAIVDTWPGTVPCVDAGGMRLSRDLLLLSMGYMPARPETIVMVDGTTAIGAMGNVRNGQHEKLSDKQVTQILLAGWSDYGSESGYKVKEGVKRAFAIRFWSTATLVKYHGLTLDESVKMKGDTAQQMLLTGIRGDKGRTKASKELIAERLNEWRSGAKAVKAISLKRATEIASSIAPDFLPIFEGMQAGNEAEFSDTMSAYHEWLTKGRGEYAEKYMSKTKTETPKA